jgi:TIR domain
MANIFVSHAWKDLAIAQDLEAHLRAKGHQIRLPVGTAAAGNWRAKYTKALSAADVLVVLITEAALASKNVVGEIGAGRVLEELQGVLLLPVLVGQTDIPDFLSDIYCFRLKGPHDSERLVEELEKTISDNVKLSPRIFISHRHKDELIAEALLALLEHAFYIEKTDIRCTSVRRYMLTPGERTSELLRQEIARAELVIGILSPDTSQSNYVLCELGASWGHDVPTFPVLVRGATYADVPSPLSERHSMSLETEETCLQLVEYVASKTSLRRRVGPIGNLAQQAKVLAVAAQVLAPLAIGIPPTRRVHGYSGTWDVQNSFSIWHGIELGEDDKVFWDGKTLIRIREDGEEGYGIQIGQLKVALGPYRATWNVANEVIRAAVSKDGSLSMRVRVCTRSLAGEEVGTPPSDRVYETLPSPEWDLVVKPEPGKPRRFVGDHTYMVAGRPYSIGKEYYTYVEI